MKKFVARQIDLIGFSFREKFHYVSRKCRQSYILPYRITDTGGLVEQTKVIERKMAKELGTKAGRNLWEMPCLVLAVNIQFPKPIEVFWGLTVDGCVLGRSERILSDCLSKTQVPAKEKSNV